MSKKGKKHEEDIEQTGAATPEVVSAPPAENAAEQSELTAAREEAARNRDSYLRACADLDNYRKRVLREKEDLAKFANEAILRELLPVIDNLERALQHCGEGESSATSLGQGVEMTLSQFRKVLEKFGVVPIAAVGTPFDPARHEAMGQIESTEQPVNSVAQELQKGYLLNDRLLRPALVMITKAPTVAE